LFVHCAALFVASCDHLAFNGGISLFFQEEVRFKYLLPFFFVEIFWVDGLNGVAEVDLRELLIYSFLAAFFEAL
jgi:hypothetical protein